MFPLMLLYIQKQRGKPIRLTKVNEMRKIENLRLMDLQGMMDKAMVKTNTEIEKKLAEGKVYGVSRKDYVWALDRNTPEDIRISMQDGYVAIKVYKGDTHQTVTIASIELTCTRTMISRKYSFENSQVNMGKTLEVKYSGEGTQTINEILNGVKEREAKQANKSAQLKARAKELNAMLEAEGYGYSDICEILKEARWA